jgi:general secretion pathway protein I
MRRRGFTLLEMLVATTIMGIAVVGLLANLSASMRNASRLTEYDRAAALAREKMEQVLLDRRMPKSVPVTGTFDHSLTGGVEAGWSARITTYEALPRAVAGSPVLERVELEVWWGTGEKRRKIALEGLRRGVLTPEEVGPSQP